MSAGVEWVGGSVPPSAGRWTSGRTVVLLAVLFAPAPGPGLGGPPARARAQDASRRPLAAPRPVPVSPPDAPEPVATPETADGLRYGVDFRFGWPSGVLSAPAAIGIDAAISPHPGVDLTAGLEASGIVLGLRTTATASPLRWLDHRPEWSPSLGVSYAALFFTGAADQLIERFAPGLRDDLAEAGTDVQLAGLRLHTVGLAGGVDFQQRPSGFRFRAEVGRVRMVGSARGRSANASEEVVIDAYQAWSFALVFGWRG